jgi:CheY-like chemotaxis protein
LKFTPRGGSVSVSAVFVPDKEDPEKIKPIKATNFFHMIGLVGPSKVIISDHVQDLEAAISPETDTPYNLINETHYNSTVEDESVIDHGKLLIVVRDNGVGMSKENQKKLFHEVVQFNPEVLQAGGGSGLGLWITNNIVNMHDGKVSVYSAGENSGCSFSVEIGMQKKRSRSHSGNPAPSRCSQSFPSLQEHQAIQALQALQALQCDSKETDTVDLGVETRLGIVNKLIGPISAASTQLPNVSFKKIFNDVASHSFSTKILVGKSIPLLTKIIYKILMVDDSGLNRKLLGKLLRSSGHMVEEAEDGLQAVEKLKTRIETGEEYDIILMDFIMPKMDGPSATKAIRALGYTSPIFGVTGNALDSDIDHFLGHGADRVMIKPFDLQLFNQNMTEMIAARNSLGEVSQKMQIEISSPSKISQRMANLYREYK